MLLNLATRLRPWWVPLIAGLVLVLAAAAFGAEHSTATTNVFPRPLSSYGAAGQANLLEILQRRIEADPFNLVATCIFFCAIVHTFVASRFTRLAHRLEAAHQVRLQQRTSAQAGGESGSGKQEVSFWAQVFHFLGEVEAIFGIWAVPLLVLAIGSKGWPAAQAYFNGLNFTEPLFVVVIMTMAASRPVLRFAENALAAVARLGKGSTGAWWFSILTVGPLLGSLLTEPAAMTISALLLASRFYERSPSAALSYATLGLLFVNISVGGTLTHFAAPPVLMVAGRWNWGLMHMLTFFGWKAAVGIAVATTLFYFAFRSEFKRLDGAVGLSEPVANRPPPIPVWITAVHILFVAWTVFNSHSPVLFVAGFLFYLAFTQATEHHQDEVSLRPSLLVGFFLAGLVVHGGLQGWWIAPVLGRLQEVPLFFGAVFLTAFNDNAAITYLASLVPGFSPPLQYAVVAGAVVGGGLTVIANAPNPAGQSILGRFFPDGVAAGRLLLGALGPTVIMALVFLLL